MTHRTYGWDSETWPFKPGLPTPRQVCASWSDGERDELTLWPDTRARFVKLLERGDHLVGVNIAYDVVGTAAMDPTLLPLVFQAGNAGLFHCCSIREGLNDIAKGEMQEKPDDEFDWNRYPQALLMQRHFGEDISAEKHGDVWRYKYGQLDGVPLAQYPVEAADYPKRDARRPLRIFHSQAGFRNLHNEPAQVRAAIAIQFMRTWGFRTDGEYIAALEKEVDALWDAARKEFTRHRIYRPDGTKDKVRLSELVTAAYRRDCPACGGLGHGQGDESNCAKCGGAGTLGEPPKTPSGQVCTDRDTLEDSGDPLLMKLAVSGKNDKRKTTNIPALKKGIHFPVTPNVNNLVATGRISCDWQQMPQKGMIREGVIARGHLKYLARRSPQLRALIMEQGCDPDDLPDTVLSSNDLGGAELRTMSQRAIYVVKYSKMAEFLNAGKDVHAHVGATFLGITYDQFMARKVELDPYRKVAKIFNFGKGGGAGGFAMAFNAKVKENIRFCLTLNRATKCGVEKVEGKVRGQVKRVCALCVRIANELSELWLRAWPEQQDLKDMAGRLTARGARATSVVFGSERERDGCTYSQWLNNPFQGAIGDAVKAAMWRIEEESKTDRRSALWGSHQVLNIHDELWTEHPDDSRRHDAAFRVAQILCEETDKVTPDVKNEVEPAIARRPFKSMTKVLGKDGRLKPYWPAGWSYAPDAEQMCADLAS